MPLILKKNVNFLIPGTGEYVMLNRKGKLRLQMEL